MNQLVSEKTWTFVDKSKWGEGEWDSEQDKYFWTDTSTSLPCLIVRNYGGALCGYVGVAGDHPLFGIEYDERDNVLGESPESILEVHGGITFSGFCQEHDAERGICHTPEPGKPERVFWFGFDTSHHGDLYPATPKKFRSWSTEETYKNVEYVRNQVRLLAQQLYNLQVVH